MAEIVVIHGYAGSGKTTQCERIAREGFDNQTVRHVSIGHLLRAIRTGTGTSDFTYEVNTLNPSSHLPDEVANGIVFEAIDQGPEADIVLVDGYPRYTKTVPLFRETLASREYELLGTVFFWISRTTSIERSIMRGVRQGEKREHKDFLQHIITRYNHDAQTVNGATKALGALALVEQIHADANLDEVYARFRSALGHLALQHQKSPCLE